MEESLQGRTVSTRGREGGGLPPKVIFVGEEGSAVSSKQRSKSPKKFWNKKQDKNNHQPKYQNNNNNNNKVAIHWLRYALVFVLVASAVTVAVLVYLYVSQQETDKFQQQFASDASKLLASIRQNFVRTMAAADDVMHRLQYNTVPGNAIRENWQWPFVPPLPGLAVQASKLMNSQTNAIYMAIYPLVRANQRQKWEQFAQDNNAWVEESLRVQATDPNFHGPILQKYNLSYSIWRNEGPEPIENFTKDDNDNTFFLPSWMGSPVIPTYPPYNWNGMAYPAFATGLNFSLTTQRAVVTPVANQADPDDAEAQAQAAVTNAWAIPYLAPHENPIEPFSDLYYPILDITANSQMNQVVLPTNTNGNNQKALGIVAFSFYWRHILKDILPLQSKGLILVFTNACRGTQSFTYQVDGPEPIFLGFGDLHESKFDHFFDDNPHCSISFENDNPTTLVATNDDNNCFTSTLAQLTNQDSTYTGVPMSPDFCPYTVTVYPSSQMQDMYLTKDPIWFAIGSACIFLITAALFCTYDFLMRKEFHTKQRLLEMKRQWMRFVKQEVQRPLQTVCQGLSVLQNDMNHAVPNMTELIQQSSRMYDYSNYLLDDYNVNHRTSYLQDDCQDADDIVRSHMEGWIQMTKDICHSAEASTEFLTDLLNLDKLQQSGSFSMDFNIVGLWKWVQSNSREFWLSARQRSVHYTLDNQLVMEQSKEYDSTEQEEGSSNARKKNVDNENGKKTTLRRSTFTSSMSSSSTTAEAIAAAVRRNTLTGKTAWSKKTKEQSSLQQNTPEYDASKMECLKIVGDQRFLTQLLRNLVANALKFTPPGGNLTIRTSWEPVSNMEKPSLDKYKLESGEEVALPRYGTARIDVMDSGDGMSEDELEALFQNPEQAQNCVMSGGGNGTNGLGLFISKQMALQHRGDLTATSDGLGFGSTFSLQLPVYFLEEKKEGKAQGDDLVKEEEPPVLPPIPVPDL